ncbi:MAG: hypothetical protein EYC62_06480 [Alphaproteobacteria bacterium]|nr:MAG: hypothetical protein EYC62_06480 [Alphaproteobacteria bacterium]
MEPESPISKARIISSSPHFHPKRVPTGVYDNGILCAECDNQFSPYENHAKDILTRPIDQRYVLRDPPNVGEAIGYNPPVGDYIQLKLFFLSILWRAAISTNQFYAHVRLGVHEKKLREMLQANDVGTVDDFSVLLSKNTDPSDIMSRTICDPVKKKIEGIRVYYFQLPDVIFRIKADKRPLPNKVREFAICPERPFFCLLQDFNNSNERDNLLRIGKGLHNYYQLKEKKKS